MADIDYPCHALPKEKWCDRNGPGGFMGHTCVRRMNKWEPETDPGILRRIGKTGEEASELLKVVNRIVIQGYNGIDPETGVSNPEALTKEIADVYAQLDETVESLGLDASFIEQRRARKRDYMKDWESRFKSA